MHTTRFLKIQNLNESSKYNLGAVDRFSRCTSAMICGNIKAIRFLNFLNNIYRITASLGKFSWIKDQVSNQRQLNRFVIPKELKTHTHP